MCVSAAAKRFFFKSTAVETVVSENIFTTHIQSLNLVVAVLFSTDPGPSDAGACNDNSIFSMFSASAAAFVWWWWVINGQ